MSSANEQLAPPPKPRMSPLDFRNTDLVSRLLAATPPYLYNMSLLPNTYFFSEMLRSFVQAKTDPSRPTFQARRTRKRPWTSLKSATPPKLDQTSDWSIKSSYSESKPSDSPLELTTTKISVLEDKMDTSKPFTSSLIDRKADIPLQDQVEPMFSSMNQEPNTSMILPPPPPVWYPSLYPTATPYGIDPLHFFIDLRVSGHIYDRKRETETETEPKQIPGKESFKQSGHSSAFSVPIPKINRNTPINLSHNEDYHEFPQESKNIKFDVKSMGFEKTTNKTGTNYIMNNVANIYKSISEQSRHNVKSETSSESTAENDNETEEERQKRVKDLRALIGLELVVDYMNHAKPQPRRIPNQSHSTETESSASPTLEVVAIHDET